ncbi:MAG: hypothetical protein ACI93T_004784 [Porticoccaceae bacterium]|jgi:hypothetical protein
MATARHSTAETWYASAALDIPYSDWRAVFRQATVFYDGHEFAA